MKKTFVAALCLLTVGSMFGQKKAVDNAAKLAGKPNKIEEARQLVQSAMENPETSNDARTYNVAGQIEWKNYDNLKGMNALKGINNIDADMAQMLLNGLNYYTKALELDKLPDAKGHRYRFTKDIMSQLAGHDWDFYSAGVNFYNSKEFNKAYEMLNTSADLPSMQGIPASSTLIPDSTRGQIYYLAGISAYSSKPPMLNKAYDAFGKAVKMKYDEPNLYLFQIACLDALAEGDSAKVAQNYPQKMQLARAGFETFGNRQPNYLSYIVDDFINVQSKPQEALNFLNDAIAKTPDVAKLYSIRGYIKGRMKDDKGYLEDNLKAAQMADADAEVLYDAARASYRYGQALIGTLGITQADAEKRKEYIKTYLDPATELALKAKAKDTNGVYTAKIQKLIDDIDYLETGN